MTETRSAVGGKIAFSGGFPYSGFWRKISADWDPWPECSRTCLSAFDGGPVSRKKLAENFGGNLWGKRVSRCGRCLTRARPPAGPLFRAPPLPPPVWVPSLLSWVRISAGSGPTCISPFCRGDAGPGRYAPAPLVGEGKPKRP